MAKHDAQPFFMRFLDQPEDLDTDVAAGTANGDKDKWPPKKPETMKYPSDADEYIYEIDW